MMQLFHPQNKNIRLGLAMCSTVALVSVLSYFAFYRKNNPHTKDEEKTDMTYMHAPNVVGMPTAAHPGALTSRQATNHMTCNKVSCE